ncbi:hypothetical protein KEM54_000090 [Ascosphaera aggregata]|nr:hypothetical protein KEM54_000090 [Ascosphaera aggregata]
MDSAHNRQGSFSQQSSVTGSSGRRYRVGHRRSPSELTPLMVENLAMQQVDMANVQQQAQLAAQAQNQQLFNVGMIPASPMSTFGQGLPCCRH